MTTINNKAQRLDKWLGPILGVVAGLVYWVTISRGAFPAEPAQLITQHLGLNGLATTAHPLWGMLVSGLAALPFGDLALRLNLFSVLCGMGAVALFYQIVARTIEFAIEDDGVHRERIQITALLGGLSATLFLAFSIPFWVVSNRAHTDAFDLLLFFSIIACFLSYCRAFHPAAILCFAFLSGLAVVEFTTFILFLPVLIFYLVWFLWWNDAFRLRLVALIVLCFGAGLLLYVVAAWRFSSTPAYALREFSGLGQVIWSTWREQYLFLTKSLPKVGWLLVIMTSIVPWLAMLLVGRRALNAEKDWGFYVLHGIMTAAVLAVMFNTRISPWALLGFRRLLATPYVLVAACFGYLVAYWYLLPFQWWVDPDEKWQIRLRNWSGPVLAGMGIILTLVAPLLNLAVTDGRPAAIINTFANQVIQDMGTRQWLVTDGVLDDNLLIAAYDQHCPVRLLNTSLGYNEMYMRQVAERFADSRLKSMAQVSLLSFLQEWFVSNPSVIQEVAIMSAPDLWLAAGIAALPHKTVYWGIATNAEVNAAKIFTEHSQYWDAITPEIRRFREAGGLNTEFAWVVQRYPSMAANNLGVYWEDQGYRDQAFVAYERARDLNPENISALMNQYAMIQAGFPADPRKKSEILKAMQTIREDQERKPRLWSLARFYGYIRTPDAFADMGLTWALSGRSGLAVSGLKRAIDLGGKDVGSFKLALASVYLAQDQVEESAQVYEELLQRNPADRQALLGAARVAARRKDFAKATDYLTRAGESGLAKETLAMETASLNILAGKADQARVILQEVVELNPENARAWGMLAGILQDLGDTQGLEDCLQQLDKAKVQDFGALLLRGQIAGEKRDFTAARRSYEQAAALRPNSVVLYEKFLWLDMLSGRPDLAETHVRRLLEMDPENQQGNYFIGSLQLRRGQLALAESSFRKSLQAKRGALALNDLAWILQEREAYEEAERLAREALDKEPQLTTAWDTLGVIMMKAGKYGEAETAFEKVVGMKSSDLRPQVHLAQLYAVKGETEKALNLISTLLDKASELPVEDRDTLHQLRRDLRARK